MRVLLINPWIYDFAAYDLWSKPLGILNIAACLKKAKCEVRLVDCLDRKDSMQETARFGSGFYCSEEVKKPAVFKNIPRAFKRYGMTVEGFKEAVSEGPAPDVILVTSGMTYWYPGVFEAINILKNKFPRAPVILGGIYPNLCFEHAKKNSGADLVYKGNNIHEVLKLAGELAKGNLDLPLIDCENVIPAYELYSRLGYVTLRTSNGCPFKCSYCAWYLLEDRFSRQAPGFVLDQIEYFYKSRGIRNFAFYDEAILYEAGSHIIPILEGLIKKEIKANFHTPNGMHSRFMTSRIASLFNRAGFVQPRLALETTSALRQAASGKKTTTEDFLEAADCLRAAGYRPRQIGVNILAGLPGQSFEEIEESIRFAGERGFRIYWEEYSPIPGTPDYAKSGLAPDADPLLHNNSAFPLHNPGLYSRFQSLKALAHEYNKNLPDNSM